MTLFQQTDFKIRKILLILAIGIQASYALQIEAPSELAEAVLMYSKEAGAESRNEILKVSTVNNEYCSAFAMKLISVSSGKIIKEVERCITDQPNAALQNGVMELFGLQAKAAEGGTESGHIKTALIGAGFVAAGILLYYTNQPKPVYKYKNNDISEVAK
ncbi:MAG: hypothetical protein FWC26_06040 [Fibromonadales bacterium]|nr:hypothetical protein [Fibromonadales bacterium]